LHHPAVLANFTHFIFSNKNDITTQTKRRDPQAGAKVLIYVQYTGAQGTFNYQQVVRGALSVHGINAIIRRCTSQVPKGVVRAPARSRAVGGVEYGVETTSSNWLQGHQGTREQTWAKGGTALFDQELCDLARGVVGEREVQSRVAQLVLVVHVGPTVCRCPRQTINKEGHTRRHSTQPTVGLK
jgi:hypothetical protein